MNLLYEVSSVFNGVEAGVSVARIFFAVDESGVPLSCAYAACHMILSMRFGF